MQKMANKYVKHCSTLLFIREMQIEATVRSHAIPIEKAKKEK